MNCPYCRTSVRQNAPVCPRCNASLSGPAQAQYVSGRGNAAGTIIGIISWFANFMLQVAMMVLNMFAQIVDAIL